MKKVDPVVQTADGQPLPFVDAHIHLWDLAKVRYPWLVPPFTDDGPNGNVEGIASDYLPENYDDDTRGWDVRGVVHVEAGAHPEDAVSEVRQVDSLISASGLPGVIVAHAALDDPCLDDALSAICASERVRGVRQIVNWHADPRRTYTTNDLARSDLWQAGLARLARYDLSFDLQCYPAQMIALGPALKRNPEVPVIINHLGMPVLTDRDGVGCWREAIALLSRLEHISIKISGFGFIQREWTLNLVRPFVEEAIDLFGTNRSMLASDAPTDKLFAPMDVCLGALQELTSCYSLDERRALFGGNANRIYRMGLPL